MTHKCNIISFCRFPVFDYLIDEYSVLDRIISEALNALVQYIMGSKITPERG